MSESESDGFYHDIQDSSLSYSITFHEGNNGVLRKQIERISKDTSSCLANTSLRTK